MSLRTHVTSLGGNPNFPSGFFLPRLRGSAITIAGAGDDEALKHFCEFSCERPASNIVFVINQIFVFFMKRSSRPGGRPAARGVDRQRHIRSGAKSESSVSAATETLARAIHPVAAMNVRAVIVRDVTRPPLRACRGRDSDQSEAGNEHCCECGAHHRLLCCRELVTMTASRRRSASVIPRMIRLPVPQRSLHGGLVRTCRAFWLRTVTQT